MPMVKDGEPVLPGTPLCVEEEYAPGKNTVSINGVVYATVTGRVRYDRTDRVVHVVPAKKLKLIPEVGSTVYGQVSGISEDIAFVKIIAFNSKRVDPSRPYTGILHVSQASQKFIPSIEDAVRAGDIIRAKVIAQTTPYQLSTKTADLGVVVAYCSVCGALMVKKSDETLKCPVCGNVEKRKVSIYYMRFKL